ncbi:ParB/RepB/Spo0J family partition protein [Mucilaginibacter sp. UC70_90]
MTTIATRGMNRKNIKARVKKIIKANIIKDEGILKDVAVADIEISNNNYRKFFNQKELEELAEAIARHGVISSLTVREIQEGKYELVVGERRLKAAQMIGLKEVPVKIRKLTDEEADEIRLDENLNRVDPHPLEESEAIAVMQRKGKSIEEISLRLGKSKAFIYNRVKLSELIPEIQELFYQNKINIGQAIEIAGLASDSQEEFFNDYCSSWQDDDFDLDDIEFYVGRYKYDLSRASFPVDDPALLPEAGACAACPFNSASLRSLFPDMETGGTCSKKTCYQAKCLRHTENRIRAVLEGQQPQAIIKRSGLTQEQQIVVDSLPETAGLPVVSVFYIQLIHAPQKPAENDYNDGDSFDPNGYDSALQEYWQELEEYRADITAENVQLGLYINGQEMAFHYFRPYDSSNGSSKDSGQTKRVTAQEVQEAIKQGTITLEQLKQEINRINEREKGLQRRDREKIQEQVHARFYEDQEKDHGHSVLTPADHVAAKLIIYQSLPYNLRTTVELALFPDVDSDNAEELYEAFAAIPEEKFAFLIRMVLIGKSESKFPGNFTAHTLYRLAQETGTDVTAIEEAQQKIAAERAAKLTARISDLQRRMDKMNFAE